MEDPTNAPKCLSGKLVGKVSTAFRLTTLTAFEVEEGRIYHMQTSTVDGAPVDSGAAVFVPKRPDIEADSKKYLAIFEAELPRVMDRVMDLANHLEREADAADEAAGVPVKPKRSRRPAA